METLVIVVLAILSLALASAVVVAIRRPGDRQDRVKDVLETFVDPRVAEIRTELNKVSELVRELERDRENKFGQLTNQLKMVGEQSTALASSTGQLREALASTRVRGQWGERIAEDVLRLVGFVEGVNFLKQTAVDGTGSRPDFTFLLPQARKLNMDVKFPLDNYLKCIEAETPEEERRLCQLFVRDVRARFKEVVTRDYIDPGSNTLDYVPVFIPNEQIYQFIHEQDSSLIDDALASKVVLCSPVSLFAILAVIRQAMENFAVDQSSNQIITELSAFKKQWDLFLDKMEALGKRIEAAQKEYESLVGTRRRVLDRHVARVETIRQQRGLEPPEESILEAGQIPLEVAADEYSESPLESA